MMSTTNEVVWLHWFFVYMSVSLFCGTLMLTTWCGYFFFLSHSYISWLIWVFFFSLLCIVTTKVLFWLLHNSVFMKGPNIFKLIDTSLIIIFKNVFFLFLLSHKLQTYITSRIHFYVSSFWLAKSRCFFTVVKLFIFYIIIII